MQRSQGGPTAQQKFLADVKKKLDNTPHARQVSLKGPTIFSAHLAQFIKEIKNHPTLACIDVSDCGVMHTASIQAALVEQQSNVVVCTQVLAKTFSSVVKHGLWKDSEVAVKEVPFKITDTVLADEVHLLKTLSDLHPQHFILFHHCIPVSSSTLIVIEYAGQGSLCNLIDDANVLAWPMSRRYPIMMQMATALKYMHKENFLHLDVKPENYLMVSPTQIKLTDFGLSVVAPKGSISLTVIRGTPGYIAPEVITLNIITSKADIFSLSMTYANLILWERDIFDTSSNQSRDDSAHTMLQNTLDNLRPTLPADCPPKLAKMITWGFSKTPANRPEASVLAKTLKELVTP